MDNLTKLIVEELKSTLYLKFTDFVFELKIKCNFNQKTRDKKTASSKDTIILFVGSYIFGVNAEIKNAML